MNYNNEWFCCCGCNYTFMLNTVCKCGMCLKQSEVRPLINELKTEISKAIEVIEFVVKQSGTSTDYNKCAREYLENIRTTNSG